MQTKYNMLYNMKNKICVSLGKQDHEDPYTLMTKEAEFLQSVKFIKHKM